MNEFSRINLQYAIHSSPLMIKKIQVMRSKVPGFVHGQMCVSIFCCEKVEKHGVLARNVSFQLFIPI